MTKEQKDEIKRLRDQGMSYLEIGQRFGVSKQCIHQICTGKRYREKKPPRTSKIKYPKVRQYLEENRMTVTALARACGVSASGLCIGLYGDVSMTKRTIDAILAVTGLTYEEAFSE